MTRRPGSGSQLRALVERQEVGRTRVATLTRGDERADRDVELIERPFERAPVLRSVRPRLVEPLLRHDGAFLAELVYQTDRPHVSLHVLPVRSAVKQVLPRRSRR